MLIPTALGAAAGALIGLALHFLLAPGIGSQCTILCRPERAALTGLLLGGVLAFIHARSQKKKARAASQPADGPGDEPHAGQTDG